MLAGGSDDNLLVSHLAPGTVGRRYGSTIAVGVSIDVQKNGAVQPLHYFKCIF